MRFFALPKTSSSAPIRRPCAFIRGATFYAPKTIDIDYGNIKEIDEREIRKDCVNIHDYDTECGTEDEDSTDDEGITLEDEGFIDGMLMGQSTATNGGGAGRSGQ